MDDRSVPRTALDYGTPRVASPGPTRFGIVALAASGFVLLALLALIADRMAGSNVLEPFIASGLYSFAVMVTPWTIGLVTGVIEYSESEPHTPRRRYARTALLMTAVPGVAIAVLLILGTVFQAGD